MRPAREGRENAELLDVSFFSRCASMRPAREGRENAGTRDEAINRYMMLQ